MKIAVYTAIFGDKDILNPVLNFNSDDNIDYFLITDNFEGNIDNYKIILKKPLYNDVTKNARFYKVMGLDLFENYDFVIWHDANLQILHNEMLNIVNCVKDKPVAFFKHSERNCIYDEAIRCIELKKDYPLVIFKQVLGYFFKGLKNEVGLYDTSLFVKNVKLIDNRFLKLWWHEIRYKSRRDQLSLPYALKKNNINPAIIQGHRTENRYSLFYDHKHRNYNFLSTGQPKKFSVKLRKIAIHLIIRIKRINEKSSII
ncbi:glycosyltransferase domain-containing protein [Flavobacterium procerum]|uniref:Glycosyltransferase domain-containing protein n=1 Tax=Flavobacterium procerum TaxID=1455569 RepID=A0ABV6BK87_9FLAO